MSRQRLFMTRSGILISKPNLDNLLSSDEWAGPRCKVLPTRQDSGARLKQRTSLRELTKRAGVPPGTPDGRDERQEVHQEENYIEEDSCEHYYGK
jgi:hypothetical protein